MSRFGLSQNKLTLGSNHTYLKETAVTFPPKFQWVSRPGIFCIVKTYLHIDDTILEPKAYAPDSELLIMISYVQAPSQVSNQFSAF